MKKILTIILLGCVLLGVFLFYSTSNRVKVVTFLNTQKENLFSKKPATESVKITETVSPEVPKNESSMEGKEITGEKTGPKELAEEKTQVWPKFVEGSPGEERLVRYSCGGITFVTSSHTLFSYKDTPNNLDNGGFEKINKDSCKIDESVFFSDSIGASAGSGINFHIVKEFPEIPGTEGYFPTLVVQNFLSNPSLYFDPHDTIFKDEQVTLLVESPGVIYVIKNNSLGMKAIFATVYYPYGEVYGKESSEKYTKNGCFDYGGPPDESQCPTSEEWEEKKALWIKKILQGDSRLQKAVRAIKSFTITK